MEVHVPRKVSDKFKFGGCSLSGITVSHLSSEGGGGKGEPLGSE